METFYLPPLSDDNEFDSYYYKYPLYKNGGPYYRNLIEEYNSKMSLK
jgi:hypothetical protein